MRGIVQAELTMTCPIQDDTPHDGDLTTQDNTLLLAQRRVVIIKYDSTEKRSLATSWWGKLGQKAPFLMMPSLNLAVFRAKVGRCPY
jgi:hypothetical protein